MGGQGVFHLNGGDGLAAANDDVLGPVAQLDVAVGVQHAEVAAVEPAPGEGLLRRLRIAVIALHHGVSAHADLAHRRPVRGHGPAFLVQHGHLAGQVMGHALAGHLLRIVFRGQAQPVVLHLAEGGGTVGFRKAVEVNRLDVHAIHRRQQRRGGGRPAGGSAHPHFEPEMVRVGQRGQHVEHDGRAAEMGHPFGLNALPHGQGLYLTEADAGGTDGRQGPGEAPPVAVEHGQRPQVNRVAGEPVLEAVADGVQQRAPVGVHDPFGAAGGAAGVINGDQLPLVLDGKRRLLGARGRQELLVVAGALRAPTLAGGQRRIVHQDHVAQAAQLAPYRLQHARQAAIQQQHLAAGMLQDVGDFPAVEAGVDGDDHAPRQRYARMGFQHPRNIGRQHRDPALSRDPQGGQPVGEPAHPLVEFPVAAPLPLVHRGDARGKNPGRAPEERQRRQGYLVNGHGGLFFVDKGSDAKISNISD